jgi:arylsulfatase A-like enzyme
MMTTRIKRFTRTARSWLTNTTTKTKMTTGTGRGTRGKTAAAAVAALLLLPAATACNPVEALSGDSDAAGKPNVLMVMTDDQWLSSMKSDAMSKTRSLLADEGVTFERFHPSSPLCCPSRSTYLSGQFGHNNGVRHNKAPAGGYDKLDEKKTLPVWMQRAGYETSHIGKYPNGYGAKDPKHVPPGWDEWRGSVDPTTYRMWGYKLNENGKLNTYGKLHDEDPKYYQTDVYRDKGVSFIKRKSEENKPFFLSMAFLAPHSEVKGAIPEKDRFKPDDGQPHVGPGPRPAPRHKGDLKDVQLPDDPSINEKDVSDKPGFLKKRPKLNAKTMDAVTDSYRSRMESLLAVDEAVEKLIGTLKSTGQLDNTYVVFTADNGFFFGQHRVPTGKFLAHGQSGQTPLVMRGPGLAKGESSKELTSNVDLAKTIADIGGAKPDDGHKLDGRSLLPFGKDPDKRTDRAVLQEIAEGARRTPVDRRNGQKGKGASADDASAGRQAAEGDFDQDGVLPQAKNSEKGDGGKNGEKGDKGDKKAKGKKGKRGKAGSSAGYEALRTDRYLYIRYIKGGTELYDLSRDPYELESRHKDPKYKDVRRFLDRELNELQGCAGDECSKELPEAPEPG